MIFEYQSPSFPRRFVSTSSQSLTSSVLPLSAEPILMCCWARYATLGNARDLMSIGISGDLDDRWTLGRNTSNEATATARSIANGIAAFSTAMVVDRWYHLAAYFESTTSRYVYVNGIISTQNTTSIIPLGANDLKIGQQHSASNYHNGDMMEPSIWAPANKSEADAIVLALSRGNSFPSTYGVRLKALWRFMGTNLEVSTNGLFTLTNVGTTPTGMTHFLRQPQQRLWLLGAGGVVSVGNRRRRVLITGRA